MMMTRFIIGRPAGHVHGAVLFSSLPVRGESDSSGHRLVIRHAVLDRATTFFFPRSVVCQAGFLHAPRPLLSKDHGEDLPLQERR